MLGSHALSEHALSAVLAMTTTPTPSPSVSIPPDELVTPGVWGFGIIAFLVVVVFILVWDMQRRIRRSRYREEIAADLDAEQARAAGAAT